MTDSLGNDRFSALHDGEILPAESSAVREELSAENAAKQEIAEYEQLSGLLAELPMEVLGDDFRSQVMQAIERRMLIPAPSELMSGRRRKGARNWWPGLVGIAASAALLLTMVVFLDRRSGQQQPGLAARNAAERTVSPQPALRQSGPVTTEVVDAVQPAKVPKDGAVPAEASPAKGANIATDDSGGAALPSLTNHLESQGSVDFADATQRFEFNGSLEKAKVGDVVDALDRSGDHVSVVRLTVVDRHQGLENLQLLLSKNSIPFEGDGPHGAEQPKSELASPRKSESEPLASNAISERKESKKLGEFDKTSVEGDGDELVCVFVKADSQLLSEALWQLRNDGEFRQLSVEDEPIELAQLDKLVAGDRVDTPVVAQKPSQDSEHETASNDKRNVSASKPAAARAMKSGPDKESAAAVSQNAPADQSAPSAKGQARSVRDLPRQQTVVQIPSRMLAKSEQAQRNAAPIFDNGVPVFEQQATPVVRNDVAHKRKRSQPTSGAKAQSGGSKKDEEAAHNSVQVLLVLVQGPSQPAAASSSTPVKSAE